MRTGSTDSGFFLEAVEDLPQLVNRLKSQGAKKIMLFGVTFALLRLAELKADCSGITIVETGGMKGRGRELTRDELYQHLRAELNNPVLTSEYGMTELLSQGYSLADNQFHTPWWMRVYVRELSDPRNVRPAGKGALNVVDLANIDSCCFIETQDVGIVTDSWFSVNGRCDNSDLRGCNLMVQDL
jgi:hypothetical protein